MTHLQNKNVKKLQLSSLAASIILALTSTSLHAELHFNPHALEIQHDGQEFDLESLLSGNEQLPGNYRVTLKVNGNRIDTRDISFALVKGRLVPELTVEDYAQLGVKTAAFPQLTILPSNTPVFPINDFIPHADTQFDFNRQELNISIPQAAMVSRARGYVDPEQWDQGLPAFLLNYRASASATQARGDLRKNYYLNMQSGANLGPWRLRNYSTFTGSDNYRKWESISTSLSRDIHTLRSQLTMGEIYSGRGVFDSVRLRGVQMGSDLNMIPDSQKGYAPVIHGIANSNAEVSVKQNGYTIYQTFVPPGAFAIDDLYPTGGSGELEIIVKEADGSEHRSVQPYSTLPVMQRAGKMQYDVSAGQYLANNAGVLQPLFFQGSMSYGLLSHTTVYGGIQQAENYQAQLAGWGHSLGDLGSVSLDVTHADSKLQDKTQHQGQSWRMQYAKDFELTGTAFTLAGYRYSTKGFYDFQEANQLRRNRRDGWMDVQGHKRSRAVAELSQSIKGFGRVYLSAMQQDFWHQSGYERNLTAGWSNYFYGASVGVNVNHSQFPRWGRDETQIALSVQIPLKSWLSNTYATSSMTHSKMSGASYQAGLTGTALEDRNLTWGARQSYSQKTNDNNGGLNVNYRGSKANVDAGYSYSRYTQQVNLGMQGGVIAHPYGVTFSQPLGDSVALIDTQGVGGIRLMNQSGVRTDAAGFAVVPYISPYSENRVTLDVQSMSQDVDVTVASAKVVPTRGAVVMAKFEARSGNRVLLNLTRLQGIVPFGATAALIQKDHSNPISSIVGEQGEVYLSGLPDKGRIKVQWGKGGQQQCQANYELPALSEEQSIHIATAECS